MTLISRHDSYEENVVVKDKINTILSEHTSQNKKYKKLKELQKTAVSPLVRNQITYYLQNIRSNKIKFYKRLIFYAFALIYLLIILYHMYFIIHPEKPHYILSLELPEQATVTILCLIPIGILAYFLYQYFISQASYARYQHIFLIIIGIILTILLITHLHIDYQNETISSNQQSSASEIDGTSTIDTSTENVAIFSDVSLENFAGEWMNKNTPRCNLTIDVWSETSCDITIIWTYSSYEMYKWQLTGYFHEDQGIIAYSGDKIHELYDLSLSSEKTFDYSDGKGFFYLDQNYNLYWTDYEENAGENCVFENAIYTTDKNWYNTYSNFHGKLNDIDLEIYSQNDSMLCATFYLDEEVYNWTFNIEPTEIDFDGNLTYSNDQGIVLTYYQLSHNITITAPDELIAGEYSLTVN